MSIRLNDVRDKNVYSSYANSVNFKSNTSINEKKSKAMGTNTSATSGFIKDYLTNIKKNSFDIKSDLKSLTQFGGVFSKKTMVSSNEDEVSVVASSDYKSTNKQIKVSVENKATVQENKTDSYSSRVLSELENKTHSFSVKQNGKETIIDVKKEKFDTNEDVLNKMAKAVNEKSIDVKATVVNSKFESYLSVVSKSTGEKSKFEIKDVEGGNFAKELSLDKVDKQAVDAKYSINDGEVKKSSSNIIQIEKGLSAVLKKDNAKVVIGQGKDNDKVVDTVVNLAKSFNSLVDTADKNISDKGAVAIKSQLLKTAKIYSPSLEKIGINIEKDGHLSVEKDKLKEAIVSGEAKKVLGSNFAGFNSGFSGKLLKIATNISDNPANYVTRNPYATKDSYKDFAESKASGLGLLFDSLL